MKRKRQGNEDLYGGQKAPSILKTTTSDRSKPKPTKLLAIFPVKKARNSEKLLDFNHAVGK
jgi:hypothetical protein